VSGCQQTVYIYSVIKSLVMNTQVRRNSRFYRTLMAGMMLAVALCAFIQPAVAGSWRATKVLQGPFAASSPPEAPVLATNDKGTRSPPSIQQD
jgi:hypothetical protein